MPDEPRSPHDAHMNALAIRLGFVLDGEDLFDAACACALCATWALHMSSRGDQVMEHEALEKVIAFMRKQLPAMQRS